MAKRKDRKPRAIPGRDAWSGETRGAVVFTVGWMFSTMATILACLAWLGLWIYLSRGGVIAGAELILPYSMFIALAMGLLTIVLGLIVNRLRHQPAPRSIRRFGRLGRSLALGDLLGAGDFEIALKYQPLRQDVWRARSGW